MYRCVRGTNAVEGYHFHLKMLIAQSCTSPRLLVNLLRCFNYRCCATCFKCLSALSSRATHQHTRWNVDRAAENEDLPKRYLAREAHWLPSCIKYYRSTDSSNICKGTPDGIRTGLWNRPRKSLPSGTTNLFTKAGLAPGISSRPVGGVGWSVAGRGVAYLT